MGMMGGFDGFGLMSSLFPIIFFGMFILVVGMIVFSLSKSIGNYRHNQNSPRLTVRARVVTKRIQPIRQARTSGMDTMNHYGWTQGYVTFEVESGDRMELVVPDDQYGLMADNDRGQLTFQGTRFIEFEREKSS